MAYFRKQLERRTYSQDRYYVLIKRQRSGKATFKELTELDEIVNRVPDIREKVIQENFMPDEGADINQPPSLPGTEHHLQAMPQPNLWQKIQSLLHRIFTAQAPGTEAKNQLIAM